MIKDGPQGPGDDECTREITINGGERVGGGGSLQEEAEGDEVDE